MPLYKRIPKRGFKNINHLEFEIINLDTLRGLDPGVEINPELLKNKGLIQGKLRIKVLGRGAIEKALTIKVHAFSKSAQEKIAKAGGKIERIK